MNFFFFTGHSQAYLRVFDASQNWVKRPMIRLMVQKSRPPAGKFDNGIKLPKPQQVQNWFLNHQQLSVIRRRARTPKKWQQLSGMAIWKRILFGGNKNTTPRSLTVCPWKLVASRLGDETSADRLFVLGSLNGSFSGGETVKNREKNPHGKTGEKWEKSFSHLNQRQQPLLVLPTTAVSFGEKHSSKKTSKAKMEQLLWMHMERWVVMKQKSTDFPIWRIIQGRM